MVVGGAVPAAVFALWGFDHAPLGKEECAEGLET